MVTNTNVPLTRRGWFVVGTILVVFILGLLFGPRSLNAVFAPAFIALVVALWQVRRVDRPGMQRHIPEDGTVGEQVTVEIESTSETDHLGRIADQVSDGLMAKGNEAAIDIDRGHIYELTLRQRGRHHVGPMSVSVTDIFGLAERTFEYRAIDELLVYPRTHDIGSEGLERLARLAGIRLHRERHEFDRLREYRPEDSLRDIHWKTSAKRPDVDFIVKEFVRETDRGTLLLSGESSDEGDDALADILASLSTALLRRGINVSLETADGSIEPTAGVDDLTRILIALATLGPGKPSRHGDVHVIANGPDVRAATIEIGDEQLSFASLIGGDRSTAAEEEAALAQVPAQGVAD